MRAHAELAATTRPLTSAHRIGILAARAVPGTFKPGTRGENYNLEDVLEMWKDRDNPACTELPQDELWHVPLAPAEDILSWLGRVGLLQEEEEDPYMDDTGVPRGDSLLEDEFDLDGDADAVSLAPTEPQGAVMSDDVL